MTSRERQQRRRNRQRKGRVVLRVEVDEVATVEALIAGGFLDARNTEDRDAITAAVERFLASAAAVEVRHA